MDSRKERKSVCIIKVQQRTSNNENHERIICAMGSSNRTVAILLTLQTRLLPMGPQRFLRKNNQTEKGNQKKRIASYIDTRKKRKGMENQIANKAAQNEK
jgi:hypothetical protein